MYFIGITGGAGCGKSRVLQYLKEKHGAYCLKSDEVARSLTLKGRECYLPYVGLFGQECVGEDGQLRRDYIASKAFSDPELRLKMNGIIHPAVKNYILKDERRVRLSGQYKFYFLEAALLIEEKYDKICDELWLVSAREFIRRERLKQRGYSDERIDDLLKSQKSETEFERYCTEIVDNSGDFSKTERQLDELIRKKARQA